MKFMSNAGEYKFAQLESAFPVAFHLIKQIAQTGRVERLN